MTTKASSPPNNVFQLPKTPAPTISPEVYKQVSSYRREALQKEYKQGLYRDGSSNGGEGSSSSASFVVSSVSSGVGFNKSAQTAENVLGTTSSSDWRGRSGSLKQAPDVYSPLWLNSNFSLPRDRATMNAWCRSFYALMPYVQNAINLHSTYPISKMYIKCPNKKVEDFFNQMNEEMSLENSCIEIAQEYYLLGEAFPYLNYDESQGKWTHIMLQNPDYIVVKRSVIAGEALVMMRPDDNLRRIVFSNRPSDIQQRSQLNPTIVSHIKRGENIPLDNFYVTHLARKLSSYEVRGCSLLVSCFRPLMLWDLLRENKYVQSSDLINPITLVKVGGGDYRPQPEDLEIWRQQFECYDEETEVLTDQGFKKFYEVINWQENDDQIINVQLKSEFKIACFNSDNEQLEYHKPLQASLYNYNGEMYHFKSRNMNIKVTPNHDMWIQKQNRIKGIKGWTPWKKCKPGEINPKTTYRFRSVLNYQGNKIDSVKVLNKDIPINLYLKMLAYVISEGCITGDNMVNLTQSVNSDIFNDIRNTGFEFASAVGKNASEFFRDYRNFESSKKFKKTPSPGWSINIYSKDLMEYFISLVSVDLTRTCYSDNKKIPEFVKELDPALLKPFLEALVGGDGSHIQNRKSQAYRYYTTSKQLANDVQEIVFKCGYSSSTYQRKIKSGATEYSVFWSEAQDGRFPILMPNNKRPPQINVVNYSGKVWCLSVPTGLFITRRNGKITIQGNSAASDKNFKIFTHDGVTIERIGANAGILDINPDLQQLTKEILAGLMVPEVVITGGGDITYANGGISLDVLRQRYMQFRNLMSNYLRKKVFAPISKIQEFYEYKDGKKQLIVPDIEWNRMTIFDTNDHISNLVQLSGEDRRVSKHTLYHALGLEWEEEQRKIRQEDIREAVRKKELASLDRMPLNELRSLHEDDEIPEILESADPSASPYADAGGTPPAGMGGTEGGVPGGLGGGLDLGLGLGGGGGGAGSIPPPPPPIAPPPA